MKVRTKKVRGGKVKQGTGDPFRPNADEWQKQWTKYQTQALRYSGGSTVSIPGAAPILRDGSGRSVGQYARGAFTRVGGGGSNRLGPKDK